MWARAHVGPGPYGPRPTWARTFEIPAEHSNFRSNVQISGRTFEILADVFRSNVRISGRTFEFPAGLSKFRPDVPKNEHGKCDFEARKWASTIFRWSKMDLLNTNFNMQRSKISDIIAKTAKNDLKYFQKIPKQNI